MDISTLRQQTCLHLTLQYPDLYPDGIERLVDECFTNAQKTFKEDFIIQFSPKAWASITITYVTHFLETGVDVSISEIFAAVVRDSIRGNRMDLVVQQLAQQKSFQVETSSPKLSLVDNNSTI